MTIFLFLLANLIPLYLIIGLGFFAGRFLNVDRRTLADMALYIFVPVVMFGFIADLDLRPAYALLPVISFGLSAGVAFMFLHIGKMVYDDNRANLLAMCTSMGNTGYFGLPVAMLLFDKHWLGLYMFLLLGTTTFEATIGYYIAARGKFTVRDSLIRLSKFPSIYAIVVALAVNLSGAELPESFHTYWGHFKGAYVIVGMMIIGAALAKVDKFVIAPKFTLLAFVGKFAVWPFLVFLLVTADSAWLHFFEPDIYRLFYLLSVVPPAANIAAFAAQMDMRPEKAAATILLGTVFALFCIPFVMGLTGQ